MSIAEIARSDVITVDEHASVEQAARLMRDRHVGALVVTAAGGGAPRMVGVVTDRDLALAVLADGVRQSATVGALCGGPLVAVPETASLARSVTTMREAGVRRLLLVDGDQRLKGIVTLDDLLGAYAAQLGDLSDALRQGIEQESAADQTDTEQPDGEAVWVPAELMASWRRVFAP